MKNQLSKFLVELALDPEKKEKFDRDPDAFLEQYSLSDDEKNLLKCRDAVGMRLATFRRAARRIARVLHACAEGAAAQWVGRRGLKSICGRS
jgi:hypothetical protein